MRAKPDALFFARGEVIAHRADARPIPLRQRKDEVVHRRHPAGAFEFFPRCVRPAILRFSSMLSSKRYVLWDTIVTLFSRLAELIMSTSDPL